MLVAEQAAVRVARFWPVEPLNVWASPAFWRHVQSVIEFERDGQDSDPKDPTDQEMIEAYLLAWISMSIPAGNV